MNYTNIPNGIYHQSVPAPNASTPIMSTPIMNIQNMNVQNMNYAQLVHLLAKPMLPNFRKIVLERLVAMNDALLNQSKQVEPRQEIDVDDILGINDESLELDERLQKVNYLWKKINNDRAKRKQGRS